MLKMMGDFETTTTIDNVRVWGSCLVDIDTLKVLDISNSIEGFINYIEDKNSVCYFHNLKFDGEFIISYLLLHGFTHSNTRETKTFSTLITDMGQFFCITIYFLSLNKRYIKCTIYDSYKKLPFKVSIIAKAFNLEESKLEIDYNTPRPIGYVLTDLERDYIITDCMIIAKALNTQFAQELTQMTVGSDALKGFKNTVQKATFKKWYPVLSIEIDTDIRRCYRGGFTYLNPKYKNKHLQGIVFDVNSLYPWVMYSCDMPYGYPIFFEGSYKPFKNYPLYIQRFRCEFKIKKDHIPTIQLKNNSSFVSTEYLKSSEGNIIELTLTSVDLALFLDHYDVYNREDICGYMFKSCKGIFKKYIDYWMNIKTTNEGALRTLAKLMLNSLYGKFATNPLSTLKYPYLSKDEIVKYELQESTFRDPVYTAVGAFITAYARYQTITTAQSVYDRFIYADTDSLHLTGYDIPLGMNVDKLRMGAWKCEGVFTDSKFLRAKTYMETIDGVTHVTCAGMPDNVKTQVTYDNFTSGGAFHGKLQPKRFKGGVVLLGTDFTIKR